MLVVITTAATTMFQRRMITHESKKWMRKTQAGAGGFCLILCSLVVIHPISRLAVGAFALVAL
jgi:hypothetical protein